MRHAASFFVSLLFAFSGFAQTKSDPTTQPAAANVQSLNLPSDAVLLSELTTPINARQSKQGDLIEAQVLKDVKRGKQVFVKAGTKVQGRVVSVQLPSTPGAETVLSIIFDRARTKSGDMFATQFTLQALAPAPNIQGNSDSLLSGRGLADNHINAVSGNPKDNTVSGNIRQLNESSQGVYYLHGIKLGRETSSDGVASMITWETGDPLLKKGTQLAFGVAH